MDNKTSKKITNMSVILTILIVLLHSNCMSYANIHNSYFNFFNFLEIIILRLCDIAVPTFFALSSFLFFNNYKKESWKEKYKSRFKSLIIPYFLWSIIFLLIMILTTNIPFVKSMDTTMEPINYSFLSILKQIIFASQVGGFWYIRNLIIYILISPILYLIFFYKKKSIFGIFFILLNIIVNIVFKINSFSIFYWLPIYAIFSYLTINKKYLIFNKSQYIYIYIISLIAVILKSELYIVMYIYRCLCPFFVFSVMYKIDIKKDLKEFSKINFLCYSTHFYINVVIKRLIILLIGNDSAVMFLLQFITAMLTILVIYLIYKIMKKICPKLLYILSGGRG